MIYANIWLSLDSINEIEGSGRRPESLLEYASS